MTTSELSKQGTGRPDEIKAVPVRHPGRWIAAAIVVVVAASIVRAIITGEQGFQWGVVGQYLFDSRVLHGVLDDDLVDGPLDGDRNRASASSWR